MEPSPSYMDHFYISSPHQKVKLPPLVSPKLPQGLLAKFSIPQLKVENIYVGHRVCSTKTRRRINYGEVAKKLQHQSDLQIGSKRYCEGMAYLFESMLMLVIDLRMKERSRNQPSIKDRDCIGLVKFGLKIIQKAGSYKAQVLEMRYIAGMCYFINAFIMKHLIGMKERRILTLMKNQSATLPSSYDKLIRLRQTFDSSMKKGERRLSIFDIQMKMPGLMERSRKSLEQVDLSRFSVQNEDTINYCLPIAAHTFTLETIVNFGMHFIKEWTKMQGIDFKWCLSN